MSFLLFPLNFPTSCGKIKICMATQDNNQRNNPFFNFLYMPFGHNCDQ